MAASMLLHGGRGPMCCRVVTFASSVLSKSPAITCCCDLHTTHSLHKDRRKDKAISQHLHYRDHEKTLRHRHLPLVELPDYSYTDGRPTELANCQKQRQERNYHLAKQVVQLVNEMKFAQEEYISQQNKATEKQQQRLDSRLKEKGKEI